MKIVSIHTMKNIILTLLAAAALAAAPAGHFGLTGLHERAAAIGARLAQPQREVVAIVARKTILATGGLGGIFQHTTNQPVSGRRGNQRDWL